MSRTGRLSAAIVLSVGLAAGCTGGGTGDTERAVQAGAATAPTPASTATPSQAPSAPIPAAMSTASPATASPAATDHAAISDPDPAGAKLAVTRALDAMSDSRAWTFNVDATLAGNSMFTVDGTATDQDTWRATTRMFSAPDSEPYVFDAVSAAGSVWMQMHGWPADRAKCWLAMSETQVPLGFTAMLPEQPAYLRALTELTPRGFLDEDHTKVLATMPFDIALYFWNAKTVMTLGLNKAPVAGRVPKQNLPVVLELQDGRLRSLSMSGDDIAKSARKAGATISELHQTFLASLLLTVDYANSPAVQVKAPARKSVFTGSAPCSAAARSV